MGFPGGSGSKEFACNAGHLGLIPGLGRTPGGQRGNPLQYSCLENPMDRGAWRATVRGVAKRQTGLSDSTHTDYNAYRSIGLILMESRWKILNTGVK